MLTEIKYKCYVRCLNEIKLKLKMTNVNEWKLFRNIKKQKWQTHIKKKKKKLKLIQHINTNYTNNANITLMTHFHDNSLFGELINNEFI